MITFIKIVSLDELVRIQIPVIVIFSCERVTCVIRVIKCVKGDALAKAVRARIKKAGIHPYKKIRCVYSLEQAIRIQNTDRFTDRIQTENHIPVKGSLMQVTAVFGCTLASLVVKEVMSGTPY